MKYYIFIQNNSIIGAGQAELMNEDIDTIEVDKELYDAFCEDIDKVAYDEEHHEIILNPNFAQILYNRRETEFDKNFFHTSLGYIRRSVTMKNGVQKDFISDLIPLMEGTSGVPIIVYSKPDFNNEVTEETLVALQQVVQSTPELIQECKNQAIIDFYGYNPIELLQQEGELDDNENDNEDEEEGADETPVVDNDSDEEEADNDSAQYDDEEEYQTIDEEDAEEVDNVEE